jgi:peptide/nickel transport system substrate-binding protein
MPRTRRREARARSLVLGALVLALLLVLAPSGMAQTRLTILTPQEPGTLLPHFDLLTLGQEVQRLAYECLLVIGPDGEYQPQLAAQVPTLANGGISADGTTYTLRLRDDVVWHDGTPFTSADVAFTHRVITDPDLPIPSRIVWSDVASVETPDPHTAVVRFDEPNVAFLSATAADNCHMLPSHVLDGTDLNESPLHRSTVGTGPFTLVEWQDGSFLRFERVDVGDPRDASTIDEVVVRVAPGSEAQRAAIQRGEADLVLHVSQADATFAAGVPPYQVVEAPTISWWHFWLNNDDPVLSDVRVRQALTHAIDRELIAETIFGGLVQPQHSVLPATLWAHADDVRTYGYDPEAARALLDEAGWLPGAAGVRERDGRPLRLEVLNIAGQADRRRVVQAVQSFWRDVGVDATIREIDAASFPPTMAAGEWQIAYGFFGERSEPAFALWLGTNWQRYDNEAAFALLERIGRTIDRDERGELIREFQRLVAEDTPTIPLVARPLLNVVHPELGNYRPTLTGSFWNVRDWTR